MNKPTAVYWWTLLPVVMSCFLYSSLAAQTFSDPRGDTFGSASVQHDLLSVRGSRSQDSLVLELILSDAISSPSSGRARELTGFIDLDVDRNFATGVTSADQGFAASRGGAAVSGQLGIEFYLDLFSEVLSPGRVDVVNASSRNTVAQVPILYKASSVEVSVPFSLLNDDGLLNYSLVVGTLSEPTDQLTGLNVVPEPSTVGLITGALCALLLRCRLLKQR